MAETASALRRAGRGGPVSGADDLTEIGRALFGERWQTDLASVLQVNPRRVREWIAGERSIPPALWPMLAATLKDHANRCRALAKVATRNQPTPWSKPHA